MFQPRLGLAYAVTPKTAFRTGLGLFYNRAMINRDTALGGNPPFQIQQTVVNGSIDAPGGATRRDFPLVVTAQDPDFPMPKAWAWNVTVDVPWEKSTSWFGVKKVLVSFSAVITVPPQQVIVERMRLRESQRVIRSVAVRPVMRVP